MNYLNKLNILLGIILVVLGVFVWITAKVVFSILFLVLAILIGLNVTGALGSLISKFRK